MQDDIYSRMFEDSDRAQARMNALQTRRPEDVARGLRLSKITGIPAPVAEAEPEVVETQARRQQVEAVTALDLQLARWLSSPDNGALARNDLHRLSAVGSLLDPWTSAERADFSRRIGTRPVDTQADVGAALGTRSAQPDLLSGRPSTEPLAQIAARIRARIVGEEWAERRKQAGEGRETRFARAYLGMLGTGLNYAAGGLLGGAQYAMDAIGRGEETADYFRRERETLDEFQARITPRNMNTFGRGIFSAGGSLASLGLAFVAGPEAVLPLLAGGSGLDAYSRFRARGATPNQALAGGTATGAIEYVTERIPIGWLTGRFGRQGARDFLTHFIGAELVGEQLATHTQDLVDVLVPGGMSWEEYAATRGQAAAETAIATAAMTGVIGGAHGIALRLRQQDEALDEMVAGAMGEDFLDRLMEEAGQSQVRQLDPDSFSAFVNERADGTPVQNLYIPAEAVRTYLQSEGAETEFFEPYVEELVEAVRLQGDLVVPLGEAAAGLAGTQAWAALREDVRVSPGGMSGREARERARTFFQELEGRGAEIAKEAESIGEAMKPAVEVYQQTRQALLKIGRTEQEADAIAQIVAARRETAGARLGVSAMDYHIANPITFRKAARGEYSDEVKTTLIDEPRSNELIPIPAETEDVVLPLGHIPVFGPEWVAELDEIGKRLGVPKESGETSFRYAARLMKASKQINTPEIKMLSDLTLKQEGKKKARGQTQFYVEHPGAIITLFGSANHSTLVHELGHVFLEEMFRDAASANAPDVLKEDVARIEKWFADNGQPVTKGKIPTAAHELFARGYERYTMEGRAPSAELRNVFRQFAKWLKDIYNTVRALKAPITPEIRQVFDRMLATDAAIEASRSTEAHFTDRAQVRMTDAEWEAYQRSIDDAKNVAHDELLAKTMAAIRRRETQRGREERANVRGEVEARIDARPEFVALHLLRTGKRVADPEGERVDVKFNTGWLIDTYGEDVLDRLPRGLPIIKGDGVTGDVVAEMTGFPSGDTLVKALLMLREAKDAMKAEGELRSVREVMVEAEVDRIMAGRHGDTLTDGSIEEEAIAAINSNRQGEILSGELRQLRRLTPQAGGPTPYRIAREWARRTINAGRVADVASRAQIQRYLRATNKAARAFEEALLAEKHDEAFRQKQAQLLNHALLAEAKIAADQVDRIVGRMQRYAKRKAMGSVDQDYFDRIHELLERFDFRTRSQKSIDEQDSFEKWAVRRQAEGFEVLVPPRLVDRGEHYSRVDVDTLLELDDAVSSLVALGRVKQNMKDGKEERDFNEWRDLAVANIRSLPERRLGDNPSDDKERALVALGVGGLKIEEIADELDLDDPNGPFNNLLVKRATENANTRDALKAEILEPIAQIYFSLPPEMRRWLAEKATSSLTWNVVNELDTPEDSPIWGRRGKPVTMTRMEWIAVALNTGNISSLEKMTKGERWPAPVVQSELVRILNRKEAWDFAQALWDQAAKLWPHTVEGERQMSGVVPEAVEALEIEIPFGTYKGGYWPAVYDVDRSQRAANNEADAANDLFGYKSGIGTPKGHTIARTNAIGPMSYRLEEILFTHVDRVTTRIAYAAWARDVLRAIDNQTVAGAIKTRLGPEYLAQVKPWLRRQINGNIIDKRGSAAIDRWMRGFRVNMSIAVMGLSYSTMQAQALGLGQSMSRIGPKWVGFGLLELVRNPKGMQDFVYQRSPEMQRRGREVNREMVEFFKTLNLERGKAGKAKRWYRNAQAAAFWHIAWMDRWSVALPTWLGAYHKGLGEDMTDEEASAYGDKMVRQSQGSGREKDLSAWQSPNNETQRFWTMFYTPFNVMLNMQWKSVRLAKRGNWRGAIQMQVWMMLAIALGDALQNGDWPEDEEGETTLESIALWFSRNMFFALWQGVPVARDAASVTERHLIGQYAEMQTPVEALYNAVDRAVREGRQVAEGEEDITSETIRAESSAVGYVFGLPGNQIGKTGGFLWDVRTGDADPDGVRDWWSGVTRGRLPEEE